jgi:hypothetical protein
MSGGRQKQATPGSPGSSSIQSSRVVSVCVVLAAHLCYGAVAAEPGPRGMY